MERNELSEDTGFHESFLQCQMLACSYSTVGQYQPWGGVREEYLGSECIVTHSWQLHTITVSRDIYLKSVALFKFFCVCHSAMDKLCEIMALQTELLLTAWISRPLCGVGERLFLPCEVAPQAWKVGVSNQDEWGHELRSCAVKRRRKLSMSLPFCAWTGAELGTTQRSVKEKGKL